MRTKYGPLCVFVCMSVALAAVVLFVSSSILTAKADCPGVEGTPCGNGDVNGSGALDIADAVYLLQHLFAQGLAPMPFVEDAPCPPTRVCEPATGQTEIYSDGDDGFYEAGCPMEDRFVDNEDGTVTDTCTGLMWQKETASGAYSWQNAVDYCQNLVAAGHSDWRLPNVRELLSITDYGRFTPAIIPVFDIADWYWSSTTSAGNPNAVWYVYYWHNEGDGLGLSENKMAQGFVRAVRGCQ